MDFGSIYGILYLSICLYEYIVWVPLFRKVLKVQNFSLADKIIFEVAHSIVTPLCIITGYVALSFPSKDDEETRKQIEKFNKYHFYLFPLSCKEFFK